MKTAPPLPDESAGAEVISPDHALVAEVRTYDTASAMPYLAWHHHSKYLTNDSEHYRLLMREARRVPPETPIVDIGTHIGASALVLALARGGREAGAAEVVTYDVTDHLRARRAGKQQPQQQQLCAKDVPPEKGVLRFVIGDAVEDLETLVVERGALLIVLDTNHDGKFERRVYETLCALRYRGLLILDDIRLNENMRRFWRSIPHKRVDATAAGHWSGTGVVVFDPSAVDFPGSVSDAAAPAKNDLVKQ